MATSFSFDIVSEVDMQEVLNAVNQANKEISQRYDFKGSKSEITLQQKDNVMTILADDDLKLKSVLEVLKAKLVKRSVPVKALDFNKAEEASGGMIRQKVDIQSGISKEKCKEIVKFIKDTKIKVQAQIQDAQVRVTGRKKDDLQDLMKKLKEKDFDINMDFENYR